LIIYYILLVYILISGIPLCRRTSDRAKKTYLVMAFSVLFCLMAFRAETMGTDVANYHRVFNKIAKSNDLIGVFKGVDGAPIYCVLAKLVSYAGDYRLMLIVTAFIILSSVAIYIYNFSDNAVISTYCFVVLYFYLTSWNISRQFLAVALSLLALCFRKDKKYVLSIILFLLAVGIHSLTAIALLLLIIDREHITKKKFIIYMTAATVGVFVLSFGFSTIVNLFCLVFPRYRMYLGGGQHTYTDQSRGAIVFLALFYFFVAVMAVVIQSNLLKENHLDDDERSHLRYLIIAVTAGALMGMLNGSFEAMARALHFYQIHTICLIPNAFGKLRRYPFYYFVYYLLLLILLVPFTICLMRNFGEVVPYTTMW
jgi:hypothetical protein